jgi:hypothetical protein
LLRKQSRRLDSSPAPKANGVLLDHLLAAKTLAERLGGIENARRALTDLAKPLDN